jgi:hypothetical protein
MTISEFMGRRRRLCLAIHWSACAVGVPGVLYLVYVGAHRGPQYAWNRAGWTLAVFITGTVVAIILGMKFKCPICVARLYPVELKKGQRTWTACPKCGADFSQPMPGSQ